MVVAEVCSEPWRISVWGTPRASLVWCIGSPPLVPLYMLPPPRPPGPQCCESLKCINYQSVLDWLLSCILLAKPPKFKSGWCERLLLSDVSHNMAPVYPQPWAGGGVIVQRGKVVKGNLRMGLKQWEVCGGPRYLHVLQNHPIKFYDIISPQKNIAWENR